MSAVSVRTDSKSCLSLNTSGAAQYGDTVRLFAYAALSRMNDCPKSLRTARPSASMKTLC